MAKNKILTVEDLIKFCKSNKLYTFSSKESGKPIVVQSIQEFSSADIEESEDGRLYCKVRVAHTLLNRNKSFISEESMKQAMPTLKYAPLLGKIHQLDDGSWDFHSHDCHVEIDEDGNEFIVYDEQQIGTFTADEPYLEYDEEMDKTYVVAKAVIPEEYTKAADIIRAKQGTKVSCELIIYECSYNAKEKYLQLDSFRFNGCTCLGSEKDGTPIGEGMVGSKLTLEDFSEDNNSLIKFANQLNEMQAKLNKLEARFSINSNSNDSMKGGISKSMNKFEMLLEKYNKTAEDVTFEYENLSDEELEAAFEKAFANADDDDDKENKEDNACGSGTKKKKKCEEDDDDKKDPDDDGDDESKKDNACGGGSGSKKKKKNEKDDDDEKDPEDDPEVKDDNACGAKKKKKCDANTIEFSVVKDGVTRTFEISLQDRISAIHSLVNETYADTDNTYYGVTVFESYVIMEDWWSGKYFKQSYTFEDDVCTLVGDRVEVYAEFVTADEQKELEDMRSNYAALKEFKETTEKNELHAQREEIINSENFAVISEKDESGKYVNEAFAKLVSEMDNYSLTDLEKEAKVILADFVTSKNFALEVKPEKKTSKKQFSNPEKKDSNKPSRYGKLFAKEN